MITRWIYAAMEAATLGRGVPRRVGGEWIRFPARWSGRGPHQWRPAVAEFAKRHGREGSTAIDVGAQLGALTIPLARAVGPRGRVVAFEPVDPTRGALLRTVELNGLSGSVEVRPEPVADSVAEVDYHPVGSAPTGRVPTAQIDHLIPLSEVVSVIKIDAAGAELAVLRGARETIRRCRPAIALNVRADHPRVPEDDLDALWSELTGADYLEGYRGLAVDRESFVGATESFPVLLTPDTDTH